MEQWTGKLIKTKLEIQERVREYMLNEPAKLYCGDIVSKDQSNKTRPNGYSTSDSGEPFCKVIAEYILQNAESWKIERDSDCTYNPGKREKQIKELVEQFGRSRFEDYTEYAKRKNKNIESETLLMHCLCCQHKVGIYETVDFQIPTSNGKSDKIDLLLKDPDGNFYMTEAKTFASKESLLRCILEIQTYYSKLNYRFYERYNISESKLKKTILIDKKSYAYRQLETEWGKGLIAKFKIHVLILEKAESKYNIKKY